MQGEYANNKGWRFILKRELSWEDVSEATLRPEKKGGRDRDSQVDRTVLALRRLQYESESEFAAGRWLMGLLLNGVLFFDPKWGELHQASPPGPPKGLMSSGENLPWLALPLQQTDPQRFAAWVAHERTALPQITGIALREREEDHHAYSRVQSEGGHEVTSSGVSEGTLRIFALTLVGYLDDMPPLLVIEEPGNSIHSQSIDTIMQSLRSLYEQQVWVSTHSPVRSCSRMRRSRSLSSRGWIARGPRRSFRGASIPDSPGGRAASISAAFSPPGSSSE